MAVGWTTTEVPVTAPTPEMLRLLAPVTFHCSVTDCPAGTAVGDPLKLLITGAGVDDTWTVNVAVAVVPPALVTVRV